MCRWLVLFFICNTAIYAQKSSEELLSSYKDSIHSSEGLKTSWFHQVSYLHLTKLEYDSAKKYLLWNNELDQKYFSSTQQAYTFFSLGNVYKGLHNYDSALYFFKLAAELYKENNSPYYLALSNQGLGMVYKDLAVYESALEHLIEAVKSLEQTDYLNELSSCYTALANVYSYYDENDEALVYHHKALKIKKSLNSQKSLCTTYNNLGILFRKQKMYDSALHYYARSLDIKKTLKDIKGSGVTLNNIGVVLIDLEDYSEADSALKASLNFRLEAGDPLGTATTLNNLGLLGLRQKKLRSSLAHLIKASNIIDSLGLKKEKVYNLQYQIEVYEKLNRFEEALHLSNQLLQLKNELFNNDKASALARMQTGYETEKKEQKIVSLQGQRELQKANLSLRRTWIFTLSALSIVLVFLSALVVVRWKKEKKAKREVEMLMSELHHRVKNNLQLLASILSLQSRKIDDPNALKMVESSRSRVNAMSLIHQNLYNISGLRSLDLKIYLTRLVESLIDSFGLERQRNRIHLDVCSLYIDVDKIIPIGLIVNELVTNSFKYSFIARRLASNYDLVQQSEQGATMNKKEYHDESIDDTSSNASEPFVTISARVEDVYLLVKIKDNGPGFDLTERNDGSMGLKIVETLRKQLKAECQWEICDGASFELKVHLEKLGWKK